MNVKSMIVGLVIAVVASTGTYFLLPPPSGAEAASCATKRDVEQAVLNYRHPLDASALSLTGGCATKHDVESSVLLYCSKGDSLEEKLRTSALMAIGQSITKSDVRNVLNRCSVNNVGEINCR